MPKRFTDTKLGREPWFRKLSCKLKCAVRFLFDECDNAGVWVIDMESMSFFVGEDIELQDFLSKINIGKKRLEMFGPDKIFIPGFIHFQYGELTENCKPHRPIISLLKKYGLYERVLKGYDKGIETLEEKEKDKEKEKEEDKDTGEFYNPTPENTFPDTGLGSTAVVPEMARIFQEANPDYLKDQKLDWMSLLKIARKIHEERGIPGHEYEKHKDVVVKRWGEVVAFMKGHKLFSNFSISQVERNIQSIFLSLKNGNQQSSGSSNPKPASGKSAGAVELASRLQEKLRQAGSG